MDYQKLEAIIVNRLLTPNPGYTPQAQDEVYKMFIPIVAHAIVVSLQEYDRMKQHSAEE